MNDLIRRKDVEQMLTALGGCDASDKEAEGWDRAIDAAVEGLRKVESADKWISINNDKPTLGMALMVTVKNHLCGGKRELRYPVTYILSPDCIEVIAWKSLPEPWKGE